MQHLLKKLGFISTLCITSSFFTLQANENIEVTPLEQITPEELAVIYSMTEICPKLVKDQKNFERGYAQVVKEFLPNSRNPVAELQQLSQSSQFQSLLKEAIAEAQKAGNAQNKAICEEIVSYKP